MPRRKRAAGDDEAGTARKNKKTSRVGLTVRIKSKPIAKQVAPKLESKHRAVIEESDQLMQRAVAEELSQAPESIQEISREIELIRLEREKRLLMWVGVSFFMLVVLVGWVFSMKLMFQEQERKIAQGSNLDIDEISEKFNQTMQDVSEGLSRFNDLASSTSAVATSTLPHTSNLATSSADIATASPTPSFEESLEIKILEAKLEELKKRLNSNAAASSTKDSSINR